MLFKETPLEGSYVIDLERIEDERGFFARSWCSNEFKERGLNANIAQCNTSYNKKKGTLRGMHYQIDPYAEVKIVRCTKGAIYDVIIDLREKSRTFKKWFSVELTEDNRTLLYIPEGFAHGFLTLVDNTEVFYQMSNIYNFEHSRGVRWDDENFGIIWPEGEKFISSKDSNYEKGCYYEWY